MDCKKALKSGIIAVTLLVAASLVTQQQQVQAGDSQLESLPQCDGSYQDCITKDGYFCEAGSGAHECEEE